MDEVEQREVPWRKLVNRRQFLSNAGKGALALGASGALAGHLQSLGRTGLAASRPQASKGVTLALGIEYTAASEQQSVRDILIKPFLASHKEVSNITFDSFGTNIDHDLKLDFTAGTGPDIFDEQGPSWMPPFANAHTALVMDDLYQKYDLEKKLLPFAYQPCKYKGHYYSVPVEYEGLHLYYNADMFKKYGWSVPRTYDELLSVGKTIQSKGIMPFISGMSGCIACWEWWYTYAVNAQLGNKALYEILTGARPWTDPGAVAAITKLKNLWDLGFISDKDAAALTSDEEWTYFGEEKAAMIMEGTWAFGTIDQYVKNFTYGVTTVPTWNTKVAPATPIGVGEVMGIHSTTKYPSLCEDFVAQLAAPSSNAVAAKMAVELAGIYVPCVEIPTSAFPKGAPRLYPQALATLQQEMKNGTAGYVSWAFWPSQTEAYMYDNLTSVFDGTMTVSAYLKGAAASFTKAKAAGDLPPVPKPKGLA